MPLPPNRQTRWFVLDASGNVDRMYKNQPDKIDRGDNLLKVEFVIDRAALKPPVLEHQITIVDWRDGSNILADIHMTQLTITQGEAEKIKEERRRLVVKDLEALGWTLMPPAPTEE